MPEITLNDKTYTVNKEDCDVRGRWEDVGIGYYEFWGAKGNDIQWDFEIEKIEITKAFDEEDTPITDKTLLQQLEEAAMEDKNWEQWAKLAPNYNRKDCSDYEPPEAIEPDWDQFP
jgi:hypothetical protein